MVGPPLPPARVARHAQYRVRVFIAPPADKLMAARGDLQRKGELPPHARPREAPSFEVKGRGEAELRTRVRAEIQKRGYVVRTISRSTGHEVLVYVQTPDVRGS